VFTGIIQALGTIKAMERKSGDVALAVHSEKLNIADAELGDSIAVNGVCLTVIKKEDQVFWADVSVETLQHTTLRELAPGSTVNLECALLPTTPLGGHIVSGHVDGVGKIVSMQSDARSTRFVIRVPDELARYIAKKGSVAIDGASLTVNNVDGNEFDINIIPHTMDNTIFSGYKVGSEINIEVDVIARYVERLALGDKAAQKGSGMSLDFLAEHGFLNK
jgi:riboflavin synthase